MKTIAFDAAKKRTGWAYSPRPRVWSTGIVDVTDGAAIAEILDAAKWHGVSRAVIENCYLGPEGNVRVLKALQEAQTRIRVACEMAGLPVELVYAQTWQAAFGIGGKRAERKLGAQRVAQALCPGMRGLSEDEADAVCLAEYATRTGRQEELTLCGPRGGTFGYKRRPKGKGGGGS